MICRKRMVIILFFLSAVCYYSLWRFLPSYDSHYHSPRPVYNPIITPHINLSSAAPGRKSEKYLSWKGSVIDSVMTPSGNVCFLFVLFLSL